MKNVASTKLLGWIFLIVYLFLTLYFLLFAEEFGRTAVKEGYSYNLEPFREISRFIKWGMESETGFKAMLLNVFGNIACFIPFGFFVPMNIKKADKMVIILLVTFLFSLMIEVIQLMTRIGSFDIDDIILNTVGGVLGLGSYRLFRRIVLKKTKNEEK